MKITKPGIYRTRGKKIVTVEYIDQDMLGGLYPIHGQRTDGLGTHLTAWTEDGYYLHNISGHDLDLVEYLIIEEYPELYI